MRFDLFAPDLYEIPVPSTEPGRHTDAIPVGNAMGSPVPRRGTLQRYRRPLVSRQWPTRPLLGAAVCWLSGARALLLVRGALRRLNMSISEYGRQIAEEGRPVRISKSKRAQSDPASGQ